MRTRRAGRSSARRSFYACHSCFEDCAASRAICSPAAADANGFFVNEYGRMSALYGAAGVKHDPELTRVLLEAGADTDDGESLYHAAYAEIRRLRARPARARRLGRRDERGGARRSTPTTSSTSVSCSTAVGDPNEGALVTHAVRRGCGAPMIELLVEQGRRRRPLGRRDLARARAAPDAVPACRVARQHGARRSCSSGLARRPTLTPRTRGSRSSHAAITLKTSRQARSTSTCRKS